VTSLACPIAGRPSARQQFVLTRSSKMFRDEEATREGGRQRNQTRETQGVRCCTSGRNVYLLCFICNNCCHYFYNIIVIVIIVIVIFFIIVIVVILIMFLF
jgi:hypothetical protein